METSMYHSGHFIVISCFNRTLEVWKLFSSLLRSVASITFQSNLRGMETCLCLRNVWGLFRFQSNLRGMETVANHRLANHRLGFNRTLEVWKLFCNTPTKERLLQVSIEP